MLYKGVNLAARPPEGCPAETGRLLVSRLIDRLARMLDSPYKSLWAKHSGWSSFSATQDSSKKQQTKKKNNIRGTLLAAKNVVGIDDLKVCEYICHIWIP